MWVSDVEPGGGHLTLLCCRSPVGVLHCLWGLHTEQVTYSGEKTPATSPTPSPSSASKFRLLWKKLIYGLKGQSSTDVCEQTSFLHLCQGSGLFLGPGTLLCRGHPSSICQTSETRTLQSPMCFPPHTKYWTPAPWLLFVVLNVGGCVSKCSVLGFWNLGDETVWMWMKSHSWL